VFHLAFYDKLEFHRDELLYFSLGLHPDFGYASIPPITSWIASFMHTLFGFSLFSVKLFPALLSGPFLLLTCGITKELGGKNYAQLLTAIAIIMMPVTMRVFHLFQPVCIDLFFWTLLFYYTLRFINTRSDKYLILVGVTFGFAMLNKYLVALLLAALLVPIAFTEYRFVFTKKSFYIGLLAGLVIFSPNLIWQIVHDFPVINHMAELNETQLENVSRINFLVDQLMMPHIAFILLLSGFIFLWKKKEYRILLFAILLVYMILLLLRAKSYYSIGLFPILISAGAVMMEEWLQKPIFRIGFAALIVVATLPTLPFGMPIYEQDQMVDYFKNLEDDYGLLVGRRFEDGSIHSLPQDYADQLGWKELATVAAEAYAKIPEPSKAIIYCENYGQAAAVTLIGQQLQLPHALSFSDNFRYWNPTQFEPDIKYMIYINDELGSDVEALFQDIENVGQVSNINAREFGTTVYLCKNPRSSFNAFWKSI